MPSAGYNTGVYQTGTGATIASGLYEGNDSGNPTYASVYNPKVWAAKGIIAREPNKLLVKMTVDYSDDVRGFGDTINIQTIANLVANAKADGVQVQMQQPVGANVQIVVNRYFEASFLVERAQSKQGRLNMQEEYTPKAVEIIERKKDGDVAALYTSATTSVGSNVAITDATFIAAVQALDVALVPADGRHFVAAPSARADLLKIDKYLGVVIGSSSVPGTVTTKPIVEKGYFGEIYGIPVNFSTNLVTTSGTVHNLMFHKDAFGTAVQIDTMIDQDWVQPYLGWLTTGSGLWGRTCLRADHVIDVQSH